MRNIKDYNRERQKRFRATPKGKAYMIEYNARPKTKALKKAHAEKPEVKEYIKEWKLKVRYGITTEDYNKLFDKQHGCCAICGKHQSEFKKALHVEHNHKTGNVRGLVCSTCNTIIGLFYEDITILNNTINYLQNENS
jgi:hypothetical protein